jgi:hypothetical protein
MKIYRVEQPDGNFVETVVPDPIAKAGEVLVRVRASGVNPLDTKIRAGQAAHAKQPLPAVLGLDPLLSARHTRWWPQAPWARSSLSSKPNFDPRYPVPRSRILYRCQNVSY